MLFNITQTSFSKDTVCKNDLNSSSSFAKGQLQILKKICEKDVEQLKSKLFHDK